MFLSVLSFRRVFDPFLRTYDIPLLSLEGAQLETISANLVF